MHSHIRTICRNQLKNHHRINKGCDFGQHTSILGWMQRGLDRKQLLLYIIKSVTVNEELKQLLFWACMFAYFQKELKPGSFSLCTTQARQWKVKIFLFGDVWWSIAASSWLTLEFFSHFRWVIQNIQLLTPKFSLFQRIEPFIYYLEKLEGGEGVEAGVVHGALVC